MLVELLEPAVGDGDALALGVVVADLEALAGGVVDDVCHVLLPQRAQYTEEELALRQLIGELLLGREVLSKHRVLHCILIKVLHRELLVGRDVEADDLILFKVQLLVCQNIAHEAELGALHRGQEHVHYEKVKMR
jgi:hypothetical protein